MGHLGHHYVSRDPHRITNLSGILLEKVTLPKVKMIILNQIAKIHSETILVVTQYKIYFVCNMAHPHLAHVSLCCSIILVLCSPFNAVADVQVLKQVGETGTCTGLPR